MDIRAKENELFAKWRTKYERTTFVEDGAPNPNAFLASPVKTVIILKDANLPEATKVPNFYQELKTNPALDDLLMPQKCTDPQFSKISEAIHTVYGGNIISFAIQLSVDTLTKRSSRRKQR